MEERLIERQCNLERAESLLREVFALVRAERDELRRDTARQSRELLPV